MWGTPVPFSHGPLLRGCQRSGGVRLQLLAGEMTSAQDESLGGFFREILGPRSVSPGKIRG